MKFLGLNFETHPESTITRQESTITYSYIYIYIPVVPHKAVAEVSIIGNV